MTGGMRRRDGGKALHFTHLYLENWRNFLRANVDVQRRVFLIGPNASGKSNLLDALRFLHDVVSVGGGFQEAVRKRGGVSSIRSLSARRYPDIVLKVRMGDTESPREWEYEISFSQDNLRRPVIKKERVSKAGQDILVRPSTEDNADPERLTQTFLEQVNVNKEFREVSDFFSSIHYRHIVPQLVREPDRSIGRKNDPFGGDFLEQIAMTDDRTRTARLKRIKAVLQIAVPQLSEVELHRDERGTPHIRGKYEHWRPQGAWQSETEMSDGTLRLLGLLWTVLDGTGPILLEEPELSLHPEVIRYVPQMLARVQRRSNRQIFISTHSPNLLEDEGIGLDEILLLTPSSEGTEVTVLGQLSDIPPLVEAGISVSEITMQRTRPKEVQQLPQFGDM